jgi:hypothetical protein
MKNIEFLLIDFHLSIILLLSRSKGGTDLWSASQTEALLNDNSG